MPRQKKQDGFDVLVSAFARAPWWVPLPAAAAAYFAVPVLGAATVPHTTAATWHAAGLVAAFLIGVAGAAGLAERLRRGRLIARSRSLSALQALGWREFEQLCAEAYRRAGFAVSETASGADGGVDLVLRRGRETTFVQCKHYAVRRVDVRPVRELYGVMSAERAQRGVVICSGDFTGPALEFARKVGNVTLVDGPALLELLRPPPSTAASVPVARHRRASQGSRR